MASPIPFVKLNSATEIPQLGFGVFLIPPRHTVEVVSQALDIGYRHIDTAEMYDNEQKVGEAIRRSGLERGELFVTSKLNNPYQTFDQALTAFDRSLSDLGNVIFPKSTHPERIRENFQLFDFQLADADMDTISRLNRDERVGPDPDTFA